MDDLIDALQIFRKYGNPSYPTHCEHDELRIIGINPDDVDDKDIKNLDYLGFFVSEDAGDRYFVSFKFGSA